MKRIAIKNISVKRCGPLADKSLSFSDTINLIFAKNESGKSYLVELIISDFLSRFRESTKKKGRKKNSDLNFRVRDNIEANVIYEKDSFIELDNFDEDKIALLLDLISIREGKSYLLNKEDISLEDISKYLALKSGTKLFERLENNIPKTIASISIDNFIDKGEIAKQGIGRDYIKTLEEIELCENYILKVQDIDILEIRNLRTKKNELEKKKENLIKAKRKKAFELYKKIQELKEISIKYPDEKIKLLETLLTKRNSLEASLIQLKDDIIKLQKNVEELPHYIEQEKRILSAKVYKAYLLSLEKKELEKKLEKLNDQILDGLKKDISLYYLKEKELDEQKSRYEKLNKEIKSKDFVLNGKTIYTDYQEALSSSTNEKIIYSIIAILAAIGGISLISKETLIGIALLIGSLISIFKVFTVNAKYKYSIDRYKDFESRFRALFNENLVDEDAIQRNIEEIKSLKIILEELKNSIFALERNISEFKNKIEISLRAIGFELYDNNYNENLKEIDNKKKELLNKYNAKIIELNKLEVPEIGSENGFITTDPGVEYNKTELVRIQHKITEIETQKTALQNKEKELKELKAKLKENDENISELFYELLNDKVDEKFFKVKINQIKTEKEKIEKEISKLEGELQGLSVDPKDYIYEEGDFLVFDQKIYEAIDIELQNVNNQLQEKSKLYSEFIGKLKSYLSVEETEKGEIKFDFEQTLYKLYEHKQDILKQIEDIEAEIIAKKILYDALQKRKNDRTSIAKEALNSKSFKECLHKIANDKKEIIVDEKNQIFISDGKYTYPFSYLSLGAKDQFFISLRLEMIKKILNDVKIFLLFDDAFQHSDYERREKLANILFDIANEGFQTFYFCMDNHIRELFEKLSSIRKVELKIIEL